MKGFMPENRRLAEERIFHFIAQPKRIPTITYRTKDDIVCANIIAEKLEKIIATKFQRTIPAVLVTPEDTTAHSDPRENARISLY